MQGISAEPEEHVPHSSLVSLSTAGYKHPLVFQLHSTNNEPSRIGTRSDLLGSSRHPTFTI